jgi:hypothetical protein
MYQLKFVNTNFHIKHVEIAVVLCSGEIIDGWHWSTSHICPLCGSHRQVACKCKIYRPSYMVEKIVPIWSTQGAAKAQEKLRQIAPNWQVVQLFNPLTVVEQLVTGENAYKLSLAETSSA